VQELIAALKSEDAEVRLLAVRALGQIREVRPATPALVELLNDKTGGEALRREVCDSLRAMGDEAGEALPALLTAAKAEDDVGKAARSALQTVRKAPRSSTPALVLFLKDPEPFVRLKAIEVLCELEEADKECLAGLLELV
jgi:HEAT repeat protein